MRHPFFPLTEAQAREQENRQTTGLAAVAAVLLLLVAGLWLVHALHRSSRLEDCLMSGRTNCYPIDLSHA